MAVNRKEPERAEFHQKIKRKASLWPRGAKV